MFSILNQCPSVLLALHIVYLCSSLAMLYSLKFLFVGQQDGSVGEGACHQA